MRRCASRITSASVGFLLAAFLRAGINTWTTTGPQSGRVEQIVVDPANPANIYVITPYGGVFKTSNGGLTWRAANRGNTSYAALRLAIDQQASSTLYVAAQDGGVFKTTDSGESWSPAKTGLAGVSVWTVAVDPVTPEILYAGTSQGLFKSTNGGLSWTSALGGLSGSTIAVAVDPASPATLYAATLTGFFKSLNAGVTWFASGIGLTSPARVIVVDPRQTSTLFAGTEGAGVFKSVDSGQSWVSANSGLPSDGFISDLAIDPQNSNRLLAAQRGFFTGDAIFMTTNRGETWTELEVGVSGLGAAVSFHPTSAATLYAGVILGAFRGTFLRTTNGGKSWTELNRGRSGSLTGAVAADPFAPETAYASAIPRIYKTTDRGETWNLVATLPAGVNQFALDPSRRDVLYAASGAGVFKSVDGGSNWTAANEGLTNLTVWSLGVDRRGKTLYAGTNEGVFRSDDAGANWQTTAALPDPFPIVWTLAVDPLHWRTVYVRSGNALAKTTDGGSHWRVLKAAPRYVGSLAIDPTNPAILFAASEFGMHRSVDGGESWASVADGLPYPNVLGPRLAMDPSRPENLYFSPFAGAFRTADAGDLWIPFSDGLFWGFQVFGLAVNATGDTIYAGTYGGVYSYQIRASSFHTLLPCRVVDTRETAGPALSSGSERVFSVAGSCGIPATARSVALNITVTDAGLPGFLTLYETGTAAPDTYSIAYRVGQTRANNAIVALDPLGRLTVKCNQPSSSVHVILDVSGYFE